MMQTIVTASHISVQGKVVRRLANGMVIIRVGTSEFIGRPIAAMKKLVESRKPAKMA